MTEAIELQSIDLERIHKDLLFLRKTIQRIITHKKFLTSGKLPSVVNSSMWSNIIAELEDLFEVKQFQRVLHDLKNCIKVTKKVEKYKQHLHDTDTNVPTIIEEEKGLSELHEKACVTLEQFTNKFYWCVNSINLD